MPLQNLARLLDQARLKACEVERLTLAHPDLSLADAYQIMDEGVRLRAAKGERQVGLKMGFTSEAKRKQMGLDLPIYGVLLDSMQIQDGSTYSLAKQIHPKIEPEIAFITKKELRGKVSREEALDACSGVCAAMEILDSRFLNFKYFSLPDVVADNASSSHFVLGKIVSPSEAGNLAALQMTMSVNDRAVQSALSSAISGDPVLSLVELCDLLHSRGLSLPAGSIVLAGAATQAIQMEAAMEVSLHVQGLGGPSVKVVN
jgi:2-oxo-3-hexenedioate decarboxylase